MPSSSWSKRGAGSPAILSMFLRETFWKYHTRLRSTPHWPEPNHVTILSAREVHHCSAKNRVLVLRRRVRMDAGQREEPLPHLRKVLSAAPGSRAECTGVHGAGRVAEATTLSSPTLLTWATWSLQFSSGQLSVQGFLDPGRAASPLRTHVVSVAPLGCCRLPWSEWGAWQAACCLWSFSEMESHIFFLSYSRSLISL